MAALDMVTTDAAIAKAPPQDEAPAGETRLRHEPALDGLRGLAVAAVLLFHLERLEGGFLGVDLFFVLSGFLITSLLVVERQHRGTINLKRFWIRRARRLFPALLLLLVGVSALLLSLTEQAERARFRGDALATLGYVANWHRMGLDIGYWDMFSQPSPLDHTWSLAIEEQFYIVWPVLAVLVLKRFAGKVQVLGALAFAGTLLSFGLLATHFSEVDTSRAYFGTDSRIGATLLGAALACFVARRPARSTAPTVGWELAGAAGLAVLVWSMVTVDGLTSWYYRGGLVVFAVASIAVISATTGGPPGLLARTLSWAPLRGLGLISYGIYLWHWPVNVFLTPERWHRDGWSLDAARVAVTLAVSLASYYLVERPIRRGALSGWTMRLTTTSAVATTLVVALVATSGTPAPAENHSAGLTRIPVDGSDNPYLLYPAEIPPENMRVLAVGDSGVHLLGPYLAEHGSSRHVSVASSAPIQCNVANPEGITQNPDGSIVRRPPCQDKRLTIWTDLVNTFHPNTVIYYMANAGLLGRVRLDDEWARDCDAAFDEYLADELTHEVELLAAGGARVVFATSPYSRIPDPEADSRIDCRNDILRDIAETHDNVDIADMNAFVGDYSREEMFQDMVHLSDKGNDLVADWLLTELGARSRGG